MNRLVAALVACTLTAPAAHAMDSFVVKAIRVEGLHRISEGTVFNYLPVVVGQQFTPAMSQATIRALFKTGFFENVALEQQGRVLVVVVKERPSIADVTISGEHAIEAKDLKKGFARIGLSKARVFKQAMLDAVEQQLKDQYLARGYYAVRVTTSVTPLPRNRVSVAIHISEGKIARIRRITIVGNRNYHEKKLLKQFSLGTPWFFSFITKNDQYSKEKLRGDLEKLKSYYQNRGYLEFAIDSSQVAITPDKESIYITVNVTEGARYRISSSQILGTIPVNRAKFAALVKYKVGDIFSRQKLTDTTKAMTDLLGDHGYAFAEVRAVPKIDHKTHEVALSLVVEPGPEVYVRRINFIGNTTTRDYVLRREMRQDEGGLFSTAKIRRSVERLKKLGFFQDVTVDTKRVPGSSDQVDVDIHVKERPTGSFMIGIGYSDMEGVLLNGSITYNNLFGTGNSISFNASNSIVERDISLNYTNPYYTQSGISRTFSLFDSSFNAMAANIGAYNSSTKGAGVSYGIPISENRMISAGITAERVQIAVNSASPLIAQNFVNQHGSNNRVFLGNLGWSRDTLNDAIFPTRGTYQSVSAAVGLPGGLEYYKLAYLASLYAPVSTRTTVKLSGETDYGNGWGNTSDLPFFENYFAGGSDSVRGYAARSLGPTDVLPPYYPVGGNKRLLARVEYLFPVPGTARDNRSMRFSVFMDSGMVYAPGQKIEIGQMRYSLGVAFNWFSPIAPLSISLAHAMNAQPGDSTEALQFTLGTVFQ